VAVSVAVLVGVAVSLTTGVLVGGFLPLGVLVAVATDSEETLSASRADAGVKVNTWHVARMLDNSMTMRKR
jgi:hypothetical protein